MGRPVTLARTHLLPVADALVPLFPGGGLQRGSTVGVSGAAGTTSLALAVVAEASAQQSWTAVVGVPGLGLVAAAEHGVALERCVLVDHPPDWWAVMHAVIGAFDVVVTVPPSRLALSQHRRLTSRLRERGTVLVQVGSATGDVCLRVEGSEWSGLHGDGHGRLTACRLTLTRTGRGAAARPLRAQLWLPDAEGRTARIDAPAAPVAAVAARGRTAAGCGPSPPRHRRGHPHPGRVGPPLAARRRRCAAVGAGGGGACQPGARRLPGRPVPRGHHGDAAPGGAEPLPRGRGARPRPRARRPPVRGRGVLPRGAHPGSRSPSRDGARSPPGDRRATSAATPRWRPWPPGTWAPRWRPWPPRGRRRGRFRTG